MLLQAALAGAFAAAYSLRGVVAKVIAVVRGAKPERS